MAQVIPALSRMSFAEVEKALRQHGDWLDQGEVAWQVLPGSCDPNFCFTRSSGDQVLVKVIALAQCDEAQLDFHADLLQTVAKNAPDLLVPKILPSRCGASKIAFTCARGQSHWLRVYSFVAGEPLCSIHAEPATYTSLGTFLGRLDRALRGFVHPGACVDVAWDLRHTARCRQHLPRLTDPRQHAIVKDLLDRFDRVVAPILPKLRAGVIHNHASDGNVLVDRHHQVCGLIDFGDAMHTIVVAEVAIACASAIADDPSPVQAAARIVAAYHREFPLEADEIAVLYDLVAARLCVALTMAASGRENVRDNSDSFVRENRVWALMQRWRAQNPDVVHAIFRQACGLPAAAALPRYRAWLAQASCDLAPIVHPAPDRVVTATFDWSDANDALAQASAAMDETQVQALWQRHLAQSHAFYTFGSWGEDRFVYQTPNFRSQLIDGAYRTIHLGLDLFAAPGTPVFAPLDGTIVQTKIFHDDLNYGGCLVVRHEPETGLVFHTLWGHLAHQSAGLDRVGQVVKAGESLAQLGNYDENGHWLVHLHLQVLLGSFESYADAPGVGEREFFDLWTELFPDPSPLVMRKPLTR